MFGKFSRAAESWSLVITGAPNNEPSILLIDSGFLRFWTEGSVVILAFLSQDFAHTNNFCLRHFEALLNLGTSSDNRSIKYYAK